MPLRYALVVLVLASGCAPHLVHRLEAPNPEAGEWDNGRHIREARLGGVQAAATYLRTDREDHVFWVRITNRTSDTVLVDPGRFEITAYPHAEAAQVRDPGGSTQAALDPEAELLDVDLTASKSDARARTWRGVTLVTAALATVSVVVDPPDTPEEEVDAYYLAADLQYDLDRAEWAQAAAAARRADGRRYWEGVLRRTTLPPNTYTDGIVHAPLDAEARGVVFEVVLGERRLPFAFRQVNIRP